MSANVRQSPRKRPLDWANDVENELGDVSPTKPKTTPTKQRTSELGKRRHERNQQAAAAVEVKNEEHDDRDSETPLSPSNSTSDLSANDFASPRHKTRRGEGRSRNDSSVSTRSGLSTSTEGSGRKTWASSVGGSPRSREHAVARKRFYRTVIADDPSLREEDPVVLSRRQKQIDFGKNNPDYARYGHRL
jgi:hypothetical protein